MARKKSIAQQANDKSSAVHKALLIIEAVAGAQIPISMAEIERRTGLSRPTAHRVAGSLIEMGYLARDSDQRSHSEGPKLVSLALDILQAHGPRMRRHDILTALAAETGESCHFGMLRGHQVMLLNVVGAPAPLGVRYVSDILPAHATASGKLLLALQVDTRRNAMLTALPLAPLADRTLTDRRRLLPVLEEIRTSRIGTEMEEHLNGVAGLAVPVESADGKLLGAVGLTAPASRFAAGGNRHIAPMKAAAARLADTFPKS